MAGRHRGMRAARHGRHRRPAQRQRVIVPAVTAFAVLGGGGAAVAYAVDSGGTQSAAGLPVVHDLSLDIIRAAVAGGSQAAVHHLTPTSTGHTRAAGATARAAPATLRIRDVHGPCYLEVRTGSGQVLTRRIMRQGQHVAFRRHGLDLVLGNAGAVRLSVRGGAFRRVGAPGQVRTLRVR